MNIKLNEIKIYNINIYIHIIFIIKQVFVKEADYQEIYEEMCFFINNMDLSK